MDDIKNFLSEFFVYGFFVWTGSFTSSSTAPTTNLMLFYCWTLEEGASVVMTAVTKLKEEADNDLWMLNEVDFCMLNDEMEGDLWTIVECVRATHSWLSSESLSESLSEDSSGSSAPRIG